MMSNLQNIDALILCGGLGTRFQSVMSDRPKGLADVAGKSILERLIDDLAANGIRRVILCVGHLREQIIDFFKNRDDIEVLFSVEETPMGTGGALKNALPQIKAKQVLAMNGDSLCSVDYDKLYDFHQNRESFVSIVVTPSEDTKDYGNITLDDKKQILSFHEKVDADSLTFINAGVYLMEKEALEKIGEPFPTSLETDFFPAVIQEKACFGYATDSEVMDIGTPERYEKISQKLSEQ